MKSLKDLLPGSRNVTASDCSAAVGGHNFGDITIISGVEPETINKLAHQVNAIYEMKPMPSDETSCPARESHLDDEINRISDLIKKNRPATALAMLDSLFEKIASTAPKRILFRIIANKGICQVLLGNEAKAGEMLLDAYSYAPSEPKAISNKALGLILLNRPEDAYEYSLKLLADNPMNEELAGYLLQAASHIDTQNDPIGLVPVEISDKPAVVIGKIFYLQRKGNSSDWRKEIFNAYENNKSNNTIANLHAIAVIDEIISSEYFKKTQILTAKERISVKEAANLLIKEWESRDTDEAPLRSEDIACFSNMALALGITKNNIELKNRCIVAMHKRNANVQIHECIAQTCLQFGLIDIAKEALFKTDKNQLTDFLRFQIAVNDQDKEEIKKFDYDTISQFPQPEIVCSKTILAINLIPKDSKSICDSLKELADKTPPDARALIILAEECSEQGCERLSEELYCRATSCVSTHIPERMMVSRYAFEQKDWDTIIRLLNDDVDKDEDSYKLWLLAQAYANKIPVTDGAISFFESLIGSILENQHYVLLCGAMYYNYGDIERSKQHFTKAHQRDRNNADIIMNLVKTHLRADDDDAIKEIICNINIENVSGRAINKLSIADLLVKFGLYAKAIELAYIALCESEMDPTVLKEYAALIFSLPTDHSLDTNGIAKAGDWIHLKSSTGKVLSGIIDDGAVIQNSCKLDRNHPLVKSAIGLNLNDEFTHAVGLNSSKWKVTQIKTKYLFALHNILENYNTWHPNSTDFFPIEIPTSGDLSKLLENIQEHSKRGARLAQIYVDKGLPLSFIAHFNGVNQIEFSQNVISNEFCITTNSGNLEQQAVAVEICNSFANDGVVVDSYTIWHLSCSGLLKHVKHVFGDIFLAQSSYDDVNTILINSKYNTFSGESTIWWKNGQYLRQEHTLESRAAIIEHHQNKCNEIRNNCKIVPISWPFEFEGLAKEVSNTAGPHFWDTAFLSANKKLPLLSDDIHYRTWSTQIFSTSSLWTYAFLKYSFDYSLISIDEYSKFLIYYAHNSHEYLSVSPEVLYNTFKNDDINLYNFSALIRNIGGKNADWLSHFFVCNETLKSMWRKRLSRDHKTNMATGTLLRKFFRHCDNWAFLFIQLYLSANDPLKVYLDTWRTGHMVPPSNLEAELYKLIAE